MAKTKKKYSNSKINKRQKEVKRTLKENIPPVKKKLFNIGYTIVMLLFMSSGVILLILSNSVFQNDIVVYISLALLGIGVILLVQRSVYKQTAPMTKTSDENKEDEESLKLRPR